MSEREPPGLLLTGGTVLTGDLTTTSDAVAVRGGRVIALGGDAADAAGRSAHVVDLDGGTLMPAFGDGHAHPVQGGLELGQAPVSEATSVVEVVEAVRRHAEAHPDLTWILGGGYDPALAPGGLFDARWLDAAVADRPVLLQSSDHHCAWVNTEALRRCDLDAGTPDPPAGHLARAAGGEPLGTLVEWSAIDLALRHVPPTSDDERRAGLRRAAALFAAAGIAWVQEAAAGPELVQVYRDVADSGHLPLAVDIALRAEPGQWQQQLESFTDLRAALEGHRSLSARTVKIFADGVVEAGTAALLDPYEDSGSRGLPVWPPDEMAAAAAAFDRAGFRLHVHAIGDAAIRRALDAVEHVATVNGPRDRRPVLTHVQVVHPDDVARFGALGVVANIQPLWACLDSCQRDLTLPRLGSARGGWQYPFADLARGGAVLSTGSDWPVSSLRPLETLAVAVTRATDDGEPAGGWLPGQRLDPVQAMRAATTGIAYQGFAERERGRIDVGARADLLWLDRNPLLTPAQEWPAIGERGTWTGGIPSYRA